MALPLPVPSQLCLKECFQYQHNFSPLKWGWAWWVLAQEGEKRFTAGIEWILQKFQMYNEDFDYPVYGSSHFISP